MPIPEAEEEPRREGSLNQSDRTASDDIATERPVGVPAQSDDSSSKRTKVDTCESAKGKPVIFAPPGAQASTEIRPKSLAFRFQQTAALGVEVQKAMEFLGVLNLARESAEIEMRQVEDEDAKERMYEEELEHYIKTKDHIHRVMEEAAQRAAEEREAARSRLGNVVMRRERRSDRKRKLDDKVIELRDQEKAALRLSQSKLELWQQALQDAREEGHVGGPI